MSALKIILDKLSGVKRHSSGWLAQCPAHDDRHPSLSISEGRDGRVLLHCFAGCDTAKVAKALGLNVSDLFPPKGVKPKRRIVATYDYTDAEGHLLFQVVRYEPKSFAQRKPDGKGGWLWSIEGVERVLYRLPEVLAAKERGEAIFVVEGEKSTDSLAALGITATTNPHGAGKWRPEYSEALRSAHVVIIPDRDEPGRKHAEQVARSLYGKAADVKVLELPGDGKDITEWLQAGGTKEELLALAEQAPVWRPAPKMTYDELLQVFRKWLALPNDLPVRFVLCAVIANRLPGDPLWAFIVGPSGDGKTEIVNPLTGFDFVRPLDTLTVNTFLSGKQKKDPNASLLMRLPQGGVLLMRDFTSVLEMHREKRDEIFSQLRKIYDGHLTRATGEGGESAELSWTGKVGLIACVTPAIEGYRAFATTLGERFLYYYLPSADRVAAAKAARRNRASLQAMRDELKQAVRQFFEGLQIPDTVKVPDTIGDWIVAIADFVSIARSSVQRDWYSSTKEITELPDPEIPTRLSQQLDLLTCAHAVLMGRDHVEPPDLTLTRDVALACIPIHRRKILEILFGADQEMTTTEIGDVIDLPTNTVRRYLEDLAALRLVKRDGDSTAFRWSITVFAQRGWATLTGSDTCSAIGDPVPVTQKTLALQTSGYEYSHTLKESENGLCVWGDVCSAGLKVSPETEKTLAPQVSDDLENEEIPF